MNRRRALQSRGSWSQCLRKSERSLLAHISHQGRARYPHRAAGQRRDGALGQTRPTHRMLAIAAGGEKCRLTLRVLDQSENCRSQFLVVVSRCAPVFPIALAFLIVGALHGLADSIPSMPLPIAEADTANYRWLSKPVLESRLLDDMEQSNHWSHHGQGEMTLSNERAKDGKQSVRLRSPTKTDQPSKVVGRPFGEAVVRRDFAGEDWSRF